MKKVLFATTALIATASVAAADVRISGYGRFGLDYNDRNSTNQSDVNYNGVPSTNITSRLRLQFDMSTETDGGVGFNARFRAQAESRDNVAGGAVFNGARFGVSYGGLLVNVGNIIGAVENAPGLYTTGTRSAGTGIDGMGFNALAIKGAGWDAYSSAGTGSNGVEALYTVGGFTGHISYSNNNDLGLDPVTGLRIPGESRLGLMLTYSFGDYYVTGAYQDSKDGPVTDQGNDFNDLYFFAAGADWGQFGARIAYGSNDIVKSWTLEGNMDIGAASNVLVWVNSADNQKNTATVLATTVPLGTDGTSWGINYQYDLGGGSTFVAGYVDNRFNNGTTLNNKQKQFQAGVYFSF